MAKKVVKKKKAKDKEGKKEKLKISLSFVSILAIVSILGFISIISKSFFEVDINLYIESLLLILIGAGFIMEANPKKIFNKEKGLTSADFPKLTTFVIGILAILSGLLSFPFINLQHFVFLAIKGLISIIVIIFIIIETWFLK